jgi:hypothetical protein
MKKQIGRGMVLSVCIIGLAMVSGCGPGMYGPAVPDQQAPIIKSGPVESSDPISVRPGGTTFAVLSDDTSKLDMKADVTNLCLNLGLREVDPGDADYCFDLAPENYLAGRGPGPVEGKALGTVAGVATGAALAGSGVLRPGPAAAVGLGELLIGAVIDELTTPYFYGFDLNLIIDEQNTFSSEQRKGKNSNDGYTRHETVLRNYAWHLPSEGNEAAAIAVVKANFLEEIRRSLRR